ncbi:hypothetical protein K431DRAFT_293552 [Polychaeton citri CBS 116435]|uniref:REJ domain-containing protein n=1 Tax=Polychaeton citri CBS 116435 TaxID=1314669 RepID=A0A9P4QCL0_9PEZI|nr:hypothetical protein K431DRAFT_293552 [Polychaeton citri CBS 116435]
MFSLITVLVLLTSAKQVVAGPLRPRYANNTISHEGLTTFLSKTVGSGSSSSSANIGTDPQTYSAHALSSTVSNGPSSSVALESETQTNTYSVYASLGTTESYTASSTQNLVSMQDGEPAYGIATAPSGQSTRTTTLVLLTTAAPSHGLNATAHSVTSSSSRSTLEDLSTSRFSATPVQPPASSLYASESGTAASSESSVNYSSTKMTTRTTSSSETMDTSGSSDYTTTVPAYSRSSISMSSRTTSEADTSTAASSTEHTLSLSDGAGRDATTSTKAVESSTTISPESSATTTLNGFTYPESAYGSATTTSIAQPMTYTSDSSSLSRASSETTSSANDPVQTGQQGSVSTSPDGSGDSNKSFSSQSQPTSTTSGLPPVITEYSSSGSGESSPSTAGSGITIVPIDPNMTTVTKTVTNPGWTVTVAKETVTVTSYR